MRQLFCVGFLQVLQFLQSQYTPLASTRCPLNLARKEECELCLLLISVFFVSIYNTFHHTESVTSLAKCFEGYDCDNSMSEWETCRIMMTNLWVNSLMRSPIASSRFSKAKFAPVQNIRQALSVFIDLLEKTKLLKFTWVPLWFLKPSLESNS